MIDAPSPAVAKQPAPTGDGQCVWDLVVADMIARDNEGRRKYGAPLRTFNGRDALVDAYQEALDLAVYLRQAIAERCCGGSPSVTWCECPRDEGRP